MIEIIIVLTFLQYIIMTDSRKLFHPTIFFSYWIFYSLASPETGGNFGATRNAIIRVQQFAGQFILFTSASLMAISVTGTVMQMI